MYLVIPELNSIIWAGTQKNYVTLDMDFGVFSKTKTTHNQNM